MYFINFCYEYMNIENIDIQNFSQDLKTNPETKFIYGEIFTPLSLIEKILNLFDDSVFEDPTKKWLDAGAGTGFFSMFLYHKLNIGLQKVMSKKKQRHNHIIKNMIYMVEIREENVNKIKELFGKNANIYHQDFLSTFNFPTFDYIIGNPPYNANGLKKVPTNNIRKKTQDGETIWISFVKKAMSLLNPRGFLSFIIPSIWMKPDKARMYHYLTQYKIHKLVCLTNTETNKYFNKEAQTPTCYFTLEKTPTDNKIMLLDKERNTFIHYHLKPEYPIPLFASAIIQKLTPFIEQAGYIKVIKTNMPRKGYQFSNKKDSKHPYKNIKTSRLDGLQPTLDINYSNKPQSYYNNPKLVLAHKMYGFPYLDRDGDYGISNRDNYVIIERNNNDLCKLRDFLSTKTILYLYESTRYRMKYLEKYAFEFIPDITNLPDFPIIINDDTIAKYFKLDEIDKKNIQNYHKKSYIFSF